MPLLETLYQQFLAHPSVTTDSRRVEPGQIFFALKGERFDGNQYAAEVLQKGACLAVVDDASVVVPGDARYMLVDDVLTTLQQLAAWHRQQFRQWSRPVRVVGITGTNGKTTTKELTRAVLAQRYRVLATEGNLNNHIGVPLTLLRVTPDHEIAIIEMGANHPNDIAELCDIVHPDCGLITNVGKAHLLGFGSLQGVIAAKTALYRSIAADGGFVFLDSMNPQLLFKAQEIGVSCRPYLPATVEDCSPYLSLKLYDAVEPEPMEVQTHLIGSYNALNCQAAATVGRYFEVPAADVVRALQEYQPQNMRSQLVSLGMGHELILDAYNANATSMHAALSSFAMHQAAHKSVVLGDMRELGEESQHEHIEVLRYVFGSDLRLDYMVLVGEEFSRAFATVGEELVAQRLARAASADNMAVPNVRCYDDVQQLMADEGTLRNLGGTILVKGSRGVQLEKAAQAIQMLFSN